MDRVRVELRSGFGFVFGLWAGEGQKTERRAEGRKMVW